VQTADGLDRGWDRGTGANAWRMLGDDGEAGLQEIELNLTATRMKSELERCGSLLVHEPAIMAAYLNPQLPKPTNPIEQAKLMLTIRAVLQRRCSGEITAQEPQLCEDDGHSLFAALLWRQSGAVHPTVDDEVDRYILMGVARASSFIDVIQWWIARKELLPAHYKMACDYLGTPATLTLCERVNSGANREYTRARQSLSSTVFIQEMCLRSWIGAGCFMVPVNRSLAATALSIKANSADTSVDEKALEIEVDQEDSDDEVMQNEDLDVVNPQLDSSMFDCI
jgi:hAT family C-terminal dimerisation region